MQTFVNIYEISMNNDNVRLLLPTINDIKYLIKEQEDLLDMILLGKATIRPVIVSKNSKMYSTAENNKLLESLIVSVKS